MTTSTLTQPARFGVPLANPRPLKITIYGWSTRLLAVWLRVPQRTLTASMARAYQWLTVLAALAMFVLAFWVFAPFLFGFIGTLPLIGGALAVRALLRRRSVWGYVVWLTIMAAMAAPFLYLGIPHHDTVVVQPSPPGSPERVAMPHDAEPAWIAIGAFHALLGLLALLELGRLVVFARRGRRLAAAA